MVGHTTETAADPQRDSERAPWLSLAAGLGEFEWDIARDQTWVSPRLAAMTGLTSGASGQSGGPFPFDRVHPDDRVELAQIMDRVSTGAERGDCRFRFVRPDTGAEVCLSLSAVRRSGSVGAGPSLIGVIRDVSAEQAEADQLRSLVAELDHRVKNVLASVQSLAAQSARRTTSLEAFLKTFSGRLQAMAAAHTLLTSTRWRGVEISHIAAAELGGLAQGQARWSGPEIALNPRATHALTLALHELAANAVKFGALSSDAGRVELEWRSAPDGGFELVWTECDGPVVSKPARRGFGSTLLERVTGRELGGAATLDFRPEGLRVVITAGKSARAQPQAPAPHPPVEAKSSSRESVDPTGASKGRATPLNLAGVRVLIVEDSVLLALELEAGLVEAGARVVGTAADLNEGLTMASMDFDVAVLDANLDGDSVTPVATVLASRGIPFIFATGYGDAGAAPTGFTAPVVRKPYNVGEIASALNRALGRREASGVG